MRIRRVLLVRKTREECSKDARKSTKKPAEPRGPRRFVGPSRRRAKMKKKLNLVELNVVFDIGGHQADDLAGQRNDLPGLVAVLAEILVDRLRQNLQGLLSIRKRSRDGVTYRSQGLRIH